ncbi:MAG: DedA family protein [Spirulina sp. SIO3F2]|nr:DedA family protein [Spirulina sp. SIO3F2]
MLTVEFFSLEQLQAIAHDYGYWAVFGGIALENTGVPLPGETITVVGGFLAGSEELSYWGVLGSAIAGAVLGDNFGYWLGRWGGWPLLLRLGQLFRISETKLVGVREQFQANAARAVFLGRFVALLRIFAGPMAGIAEMPYLRFLVCNLGGAFLWASVMVTLAFFAGRLVPLAQLVQWVAQFGTAMLGIVVVAVVVANRLKARRVEAGSELNSSSTPQPIVDMETSVVLDELA